MNLHRRHLLSGLGLLVAGWSLHPGLALAGVRRDSRVLMGTRVDMVVPNAPDAASAIEAAWAEMQRQERLMSRYRSESLVSALNRQAGRGSVQAPPELLAVLRQAAALSERTRGDFDISVGAYDGWSFDPAQPRRPSAQELLEERRLVNHRDVRIEGDRVRLARPGMRIDLGGFAKGHAVDNAIALLRAQGIRHAMVSAGGDSQVLGDRRGRPWSVAIRDPRREGAVVAVLPLEDVSISTSGDYERFFERDGVRHHHLLDPRTGESARGVRSVTILAPDGLTCEALSKTVFVLGPARGLALIHSLPDVDAVVIDAEGAMHVSQGLAQPLNAGAAAAATTSRGDLAP